MPKVLVTVWGCNTLENRLRTEHTLVWLQNRVCGVAAVNQKAKDNCPSSFVPDYTMVVAPEYLFAKVSARPFLSEQEKESVRLTASQMCRADPRMIMIPGTTLWAKSMIRPENKRLKRGTTTPKPGGELRDFNKPEYREAVGGTLKILGTRLHHKMYTALSEDTFAKTEKWATEAPNAARVLVRNSGFVIWAGNVFTQHKRYANVGLNGLSELAEDVNWDNALFMPGGHQTLPPVFGMRMGLEICAEHEIGPLKKLLPGLDFQIIVSASIEVDVANVAAKDGGYVVHADSLQSGVYRREGSDLVPVKALGSFEVMDAGVSTGSATFYACEV